MLNCIYIAEQVKFGVRLREKVQTPCVETIVTLIGTEVKVDHMRAELKAAADPVTRVCDVPVGVERAVLGNHRAVYLVSAIRSKHRTTPCSKQVATNTEFGAKEVDGLSDVLLVLVDKWNNGRVHTRLGAGNKILSDKLSPDHLIVRHELPKG